jgi:hypothetical protein
MVKLHDLPPIISNYSIMDYDLIRSKQECLSGKPPISAMPELTCQIFHQSVNQKLLSEYLKENFITKDSS